jgi:hypothetical protein
VSTGLGLGLPKHELQLCNAPSLWLHISPPSSLGLTGKMSLPVFVRLKCAWGELLF